MEERGRERRIIYIYTGNDTTTNEYNIHHILLYVISETQVRGSKEEEETEVKEQYESSFPSSEQ